jgi:4-amino-4-deoxy-L-arabinose transferase-like glycosyltransferase
MLKLSQRFGLDIIRLGQAFSWFNGLIAISCVYSLSKLLVKNRYLALLSAMLVATNLQFLTFSSRSGNDLPAISLQLLSLTLLLYSEAANKSKFVFWAGLFNALYCVNYFTLPNAIFISILSMETCNHAPNFVFLDRILVGCRASNCDEPMGGTNTIL